MQLEKNHVFNLFDTNGRRCDVINALDIYLSFLYKENDKNDFEWAPYPSSMVEFLFYKNAIENSPEIFKEHNKYDSFVKDTKEELDQYFKGNRKPLESKLNSDEKLRERLDLGIEDRARHYSSNLYKLGLITSNRVVSPAGKAFLGKDFKCDPIEELFPLQPANIAILRQLLKLRIFTKKDSITGKRSYYSPFNMALYLLMQNQKVVDEETFRTIVQMVNPYFSIKNPNIILNKYLSDKESFAEVEINIPSEFRNNQKLIFSDFSKYIKNFKSSKVETIYYEFYCALYDFNHNKNEGNFDALTAVMKKDDGKDKLRKAFGFGQNIFKEIDGIGVYGLTSFLIKNAGHELLNPANLNQAFFTAYIKSKYYDSAREYSDTTKRMLSATGLFRFDKSLPILNYKDILQSVFDINHLDIFGTVDEKEYLEYEGNDDVSCSFFKSETLSEILAMNAKKVSDTIEKVGDEYGVGLGQIKESVKNKAEHDFINHIDKKYTKKNVLNILRLFSDRSNDKLIKSKVNPEASIPTIYEFITAIAWYYISDKKMDLFDSINLTLNANFEPILHAGGGVGDVVDCRDDCVMMLEVTLMDKNAQKKGEMEPVQRHSINLKAKYADKETMTFFISDELDPNTVITWRAGALVTYTAANGKTVDNVRIMAFTNQELCEFVENDITSTRIYEVTKQAYETFDIKPGWREKIVQNILA